MTYQRYQDADLANATPEVSLENSYGSPSRAWIYWTAAAAAAILIFAVALTLAFRRRAPKETAPWQLPETLTPFTVLGLLRRIQAKNGFDQAGKEELANSIALVETRYFAADGTGRPDLRSLAEDWVRKAR